jgi:large subunit ribosomal protein L21
VQPDQTLDIDRVAAEAGALVEFREVLLVSGDGDVQLGTPFVEGARVVAEVLDQGRGKKLLVFKYKNKTRYRRRHGHRQAYTRLAIRQILTDGQAAGAEDKPAGSQRRRAAPKAKRREEGPEAAIREAAADSSTETPAAEAIKKTRRSTRAPTATQEQAGGGLGAPEAAPVTPEGEAKLARPARAKKTADSGE